MAAADPDESAEQGTRRGGSRGEIRSDDDRCADVPGGFERLLDEDGRTIQRGLD